MPRQTHDLITLKGTNKCYVSLGRKMVYLGLADDPETQIAYHQAVLDYLTGRASTRFTVEELCAKYLKHAEVYYRHGSQLDVVKTAIKYVLESCGELPADRFRPRDLKGVRDAMIKAKLCRKTCNSLTSQIRRMWKWAAAEGLLEAAVYQGLCVLDGLRRGRSNAKEPEPVTPVSEEHIKAVQPHVGPVVWAMIQVQLLTGARSGEIVGLRGSDINQEGSVWTAVIEQHKTAYRGKRRTIYFGPQAQAILRPWILQAKGGYLFSPRKSETIRYSVCLFHRHKGSKPKPRKTSRTLRDHWTVSSYRRAITYACAKAGIPHWHPHQLRHTAATLIRREHGLEAAQVILGHATADVTQIYAERNEALAKTIALKMG